METVGCLYLQSGGDLCRFIWCSILIRFLYILHVGRSANPAQYLVQTSPRITIPFNYVLPSTHVLYCRAHATLQELQDAG